MKINLVFALLPLLAIIISACKKEDNPNNPTGSDPKVYVAGYWGGDSYLWVDGIPTKLSEGGLGSVPFDVKVSGNDVYVCGREANYAVYWKNGKRVRLNDGSKFSQALKLFISDTDIYVIGHQEVESLESSPKLWINGKDVPVNIPGEGSFTDVYVSGKDVYILGWYYNDQANTIPFLWKNSVIQDLTDGSISTMPTAIFVKANDIYIAGYEKNGYQRGIPVFWKNGVKSYLENSGNRSQVSSIFVSGTDLYIGGYKLDSITNHYVPVYWKNGDLHLMGHSDQINSLYRSFFLYNNEMYATGPGEVTGEPNKTTYSRNNEFIMLADTNIITSGEAIYVK
ncbi:MAG: hypothetical protein HXX13_03370 [Bacteroidetes bacterium]|nr:hypothetical protein [Bacteroidota bacterium]